MKFDYHGAFFKKKSTLINSGNDNIATFRHVQEGVTLMEMTENDTDH